MISMWTPWGTQVKFTGLSDSYKELEGGAYVPCHKALTPGECYYVERIEIFDWRHEIYLTNEDGELMDGYFSNLFFEYPDPIAMKKYIMIEFFGNENGPQ